MYINYHLKPDLDNLGGEIYTNFLLNHLFDPSKNSFRLDSWFSIRVFEGLNEIWRRN